MATRAISHTTTDPSGTAVGAGWRVTAVLMPTAGFRISDSTGIARLESTTTDASGAFILNLEENSNIAPPSNSWWLVTIELPESLGGAQLWPISVGSSNATLKASLITPSADSGLAMYLTQAVADARYLQSGSFLPVTADGLQYVSATGSDLANGLAWGTAKATINAAIAALPSGGGRVLVGVGAFAPFSISRDDVEVYGMGKYATTIVLTTAGVGITMNGSSASLNERLAIRDMTIDARNALAGWTGLQIDNVRVAEYSNVWVNGIGAPAGVGVDIIGSNTKSCYFNTFHETDVSCAGATGICIRIGDNCNGHKFYGGIVEGSAKALVMKPTTTKSGTNYFDQVAWQTTNATMFDIGGGGVNAADNYWLNCRTEPGTAVTITLGALALRNFFLNSLDSNVTVSDSAANETTIINMSPPIFKWGRAQPVGTPYDTAQFTGTNTGKSGIIVGATRWAQGTGSPEGVVAAEIGSLYSRTDGGAGTTLYVKESGVVGSSTGWVAK